MYGYKKNGLIAGEYDENCAARCYNGVFVGKKSEGVTAFRGIPFALPPTGARRWKRPLPPEMSDNVYEAFYNGAAAIQTKLKSERASLFYQSEDCLYLNVWTADNYQGQKRPVMVFIHGGNYGWGGTADPLYDGYNFVKAHPDVVLVTIAYRVGIAGFMDFSEVPGGDAYKESGNVGLLDQIYALKYIKENIAGFGGDPDNVTVFGESAGGGSVSLLPLIPEAKGLFRRIIAESGSVVLTYSKQECLPLTRELMKAVSAKSMDDLLALSEEQLEAANKILKGNNNFPERDGVILPEDPYASYDKGEAYPVDMLAGTNADELRYWIQDVGGLVPYRHLSHLLFGMMLKQLDNDGKHRAKQFIRLQKERGLKGKPWQVTEFFNEMLFRLPALRQGEAHAKNGNKFYLYYWKYPSAKKYLGACHAVELAYVFNNLTDTIYTGDNIHATLAKNVQNMWVNFAKTGDPSTGVIKWEPYTEKAHNTVILDSTVRAEKEWREEEKKCLEPLLKYYFNGNSIAPSTDPKKILIPAAIILGGAAAAAVILYFLLR